MLHILLKKEWFHETHAKCYYYTINLVSSLLTDKTIELFVFWGSRIILFVLQNKWWWFKACPSTCWPLEHLLPDPCRYACFQLICMSWFLHHMENPAWAPSDQTRTVGMPFHPCWNANWQQNQSIDGQVCQQHYHRCSGALFFHKHVTTMMHHYTVHVNHGILWDGNAAQEEGFQNTQLAGHDWREAHTTCYWLTHTTVNSIQKSTTSIELNQQPCICSLQKGLFCIAQANPPMMDCLIASR